MSRWQDQFDAHPIHETLKQLRELVNTAFDDVEEKEISERRRFGKIISAYQNSLSGLDAEFVPFSQLDSLNTALRQPNIFGQISNYSSNGNVDHITAANDQISNLIAQMFLILPFNLSLLRSDEIKNLEKSVDYVSDALSSKKDALSKQIEELSTSVTSTQQSVSKLEALIETRKTETDTHLSTWQKQFSEAQERRGTEYTAWREKIDEKASVEVQALITKSTNTFTEFQSKFENDIDEIINDADAKHKEILGLYHLVAGDSVGAGYLRNADDEKKLANIWRRVSIGFIVVTVGWLFYAYCQPSAVNELGNIIWSKLMTIVSLTGVLLFGAAYSSQQSNRHRSNEKKTRWFALQVKAIDPFINTLEETDRNQLKKLLSERLFGNFDEDNEKGSTVIDEHALNVVVKSITAILSKIPK